MGKGLGLEGDGDWRKGRVWLAYSLKTSYW